MKFSQFNRRGNAEATSTGPGPVRHSRSSLQPSYRKCLYLLDKAVHFFHNKRHPMEMGADEVGRFLSYLTTDREVAASTQSQALNAILFLYRDVLKIDMGRLENVVRAKKPKRLPVVLTNAEVVEILNGMSGTPRLVASLLYYRTGDNYRGHFEPPPF